MYPIISELLTKNSSGTVFKCFGIFHWIYLMLMIGIAVFSILRLWNKSDEEKKRGTNIFINIVFALYIADFFIMPFVLGEIDVDKLPFHSCTSMCVMCFWSNHNRFLEKFRTHFAMLGMICNLMYMVYPSGVAAYEVHPFSYRAAQTLIFHSFMIIYGIHVILFDKRGLALRDCGKDAIILLCLTCWAFIGNSLYSGELGSYSHDFNWFFIKQDPFYLLPESIAPYLAPVLNFVAFFAIELIARFIYTRVDAAVIAKREGADIITTEASLQN